MSKLLIHQPVKAIQELFSFFSFLQILGLFSKWVFHYISSFILYINFSNFLYSSIVVCVCMCIADLEKVTVQYLKIFFQLFDCTVCEKKCWRGRGMNWVREHDSPQTVKGYHHSWCYLAGNSLWFLNHSNGWMGGMVEKLFSKEKIQKTKKNWTVGREGRAG